METKVNELTNVAEPIVNTKPQPTFVNTPTVKDVKALVKESDMHLFVDWHEITEDIIPLEYDVEYNIESDTNSRVYKNFIKLYDLLKKNEKIVVLKNVITVDGNYMKYAICQSMTILKDGTIALNLHHIDAQPKSFEELTLYFNRPSEEPGGHSLYVNYK